MADNCPGCDEEAHADGDDGDDDTVGDGAYDF